MILLLLTLAQVGVVKNVMKTPGKHLKFLGEIKQI